MAEDSAEADLVAVGSALAGWAAVDSAAAVKAEAGLEAGLVAEDSAEAEAAAVAAAVGSVAEDAVVASEVG